MYTEFVYIIPILFKNIAIWKFYSSNNIGTYLIYYLWLSLIVKLIICIMLNQNTSPIEFR